MEISQDFLHRFFGVALQGRTYLNLLYLLIVFPLGIIYFTIVINGFSISIGLLILIIGVFIAFLFLILTRGISTQLVTQSHDHHGKPIAVVKNSIKGMDNWHTSAYRFIKSISQACRSLNWLNR